MAQDPDREEEQAGQDELLTSHALDMVTMWTSNGVSAEIEADMIRGVLESNNIPVMVVGASQYPNLPVEVRVPRGKLKEAEELCRMIPCAEMVRAVDQRFPSGKRLPVEIAVLERIAEHAERIDRHIGVADRFTQLLG